MTAPAPLTEKRILQAAIAAGACVPVFAGLSGALSGISFLSDTPLQPALDNHFRYLSGILLAIGLLFWASIPAIETHTVRVRTLTVLVVIGGIARLYGAFAAGTFSPPVCLALGMELAVTPALCLWQGRIASRFHKDFV